MNKILLIESYNKYNFNINSTYKNYVLLVDRGSYDSIIKTCVIAHIFNKEKKLAPIILHNSNLTNKKKNIYKFFGIKIFYNVDNKLFIKSFLDTLYAIYYLLFNNLENFIKKFSLNNLKIGDLIYDSYLRFKEDFYKPNKFSFNFIKNIFIAINKLYFIRNIFDISQNNIRAVLLSQFCYANSSTLIAKYLKSKKIQKFLLSGPNFYKIDPSNNLIHPFVVKKKKLNINNFNRKEKKIYKNHLRKRFSGKLWYRPDVVKAYSKTKYYDLSLLKKELNIPQYKKFKKIILFGCHAFKDACHSTGDMLFRDYFDQLDKTINHIKDNDNNLWIFKQHPFSNFFNEQNFLNNYFKIKGLSDIDHIKIAPQKISNQSIMKICDTVVTCSSTLGLELAAFFGKKPILAGSAYYSNLGYTYDCKSKQEYFDVITNFNIDTKLKKKQINDANKTLYLIECKNKMTNFGNIFPPQRIKKNNQYVFLKEEQYLDVISKNLNKFNPTKDPYYQYLRGIIIN